MFCGPEIGEKGWSYWQTEKTRNLYINRSNCFHLPIFESFFLCCNVLSEFNVASPTLVRPVRATSNKHSSLSPQTFLASSSKVEFENNEDASSINIGVKKELRKVS